VWLYTPGEGIKPSGVPESHLTGKESLTRFDWHSFTIDATTGWTYGEGGGSPP